MRLDGLESRVEELSRTLDRLTQRFDCVQPGDLARRLEELRREVLALSLPRKANTFFLEGSLKILSRVSWVFEPEPSKRVVGSKPLSQGAFAKPADVAKGGMTV